MQIQGSGRTAISNTVFAVTVVVLLVVAASGFLLYANRSPMEETMTVTSTASAASSTQTSTMSNEAVAFAAVHGQMFGSGWLVVAPLGNGDYAVTVQATGLEPSAMGNYIVEAAQKTGQMANVPIAGTNDTQSEFDADVHGTGVYFTTLMENPASTYESVSLVYLPGMEMQNATVVATAPLTM